MQDLQNALDEENSELFFELLKAYIVNVQNIDECDDDDTPLDQFDSMCHSVPNGISVARTRLQEEDLLFMVNVSEQVKRPQDMLMFLGEYFKEVIYRTQKISDAIKEGDSKKGNSVKQQSDFYITYEIMNSLGTACKMFLENPRQELRISIALARNPYFQGEEQIKAIKKNI